MLSRDVARYIKIVAIKYFITAELKISIKLFLSITIERPTNMLAITTPTIKDIAPELLEFLFNCAKIIGANIKLHGEKLVRVPKNKAYASDLLASSKAANIKVKATESLRVFGNIFSLKLIY